MTVPAKQKVFADREFLFLLSRNKCILPYAMAEDPYFGRLPEPLNFPRSPTRHSVRYLLEEIMSATYADKYRTFGLLAVLAVTSLPLCAQISDSARQQIVEILLQKQSFTSSQKKLDSTLAF